MVDNPPITGHLNHLNLLMTQPRSHRNVFRLSDDSLSNTESLKVSDDKKC